MDATTQKITNHSSRRGDSLILGGNVVLHAISMVDRQLPTFVNRAAKTAVILTGILVVRIVLRIVNMLFRAIATEAVHGDFEFTSPITKAHKPKYPKEQ